VKLYVDLETLQLIEGPGFRNPVTSLRFKRGDGAKLEVVFLESGTTPVEIGDPLTLDLQFGVKPRNRFDVGYLVFTDEWTIPDLGAQSPSYLCSPNFHTAELDSALQVGSATGSELTEVFLMGEISWREGAGDPTSTRTFTVIVENDVNRGTEGTPEELPDADDWLADRAPLWWPEVTGYTGGSADKVDGVDVDELPDGALIQVSIGGLLHTYQLSTAAGVETIPTLIVSDVDPARIWTLLAAVATELNFPSAPFESGKATVLAGTSLVGGEVRLDGGSLVGAGGKLRIAGGTSQGNGGSSSLYGGNGSGTGAGGQAVVSAGDSSSAMGGYAALRAGGSNSGNGGNVSVRGGYAYYANAGDALLSGGACYGPYCYGGDSVVEGGLIYGGGKSGAVRIRSGNLYGAGYLGGVYLGRSGDKISFFGGIPASQQTLAATPTATQISTVLRNFGLTKL
jgi:hypothetical protein